MLIFSKNGIHGYLFATVLTGACGLVYQVIWQRYLATLAGSDAKSSVLIVSVFLLGLACGYAFFGRLSLKVWSRHQALKFYGLIELLIAGYAVCFPFLFLPLKVLSFRGPNHLAFDFLIVVMAIGLPTFLMGATVPLLTLALPSKAEEINPTHAKIYGWNTVGAFIGVLLGGLFVVPTLGLSTGLLIFASINFAMGFIFYNNNLKGDCHQQKASMPSSGFFSNQLLYWLLFSTGAVVTALEMLCVRAMGLAIGMSTYVFPIVVGNFVVALGVGSLCVRIGEDKSKVLVNRLLFASSWMLLLLLALPYWPIWINSARVSMETTALNFHLFNLLCFFFLSVFLFPMAFTMGQLLPISYGLIEKTSEDFAEKCGRLYFSNTFGAVFGTVFLGYIGFYFLDLQTLFMVSTLILAIWTLVLSWKIKKNLYLIYGLLVTVVVLCLPKWDRHYHEFGIFRQKNFNERIHFQGHHLVHRERGFYPIEIKDGPNATISIVENQRQRSEESRSQIEKLTGYDRSYSMLVNGKSDSATDSDFSTTYLLGALGYFFGPKRTDLQVAIVGLGSGVTAGTMSLARDIEKIEIVEISLFAIELVKKIKNRDYDLYKSPKVKFQHMDAFRFFTRSKQELDIIVSEPSNPWMVGIENLYTREFYSLVHERLTADGVFVQWLHTYAFSDPLFAAVAKNIIDVFPHVKVFETLNGDMAFVASKVSLDFLKNRERFKESSLVPRNAFVGIAEPTDLFLLQKFNRPLLEDFSQKFAGTHSLIRPTLSFRAYKDFFLRNEASFVNIPEALLRGEGFMPEKLLATNAFLQKKKDVCDEFQSIPQRYRTACRIKKHILKTSRK